MFSFLILSHLILLESEIYGIPGVIMLFGGGVSSVDEVLLAMKDESSMPVIVFKGSGGVADLLASAVRFDGFFYRCFVVLFT